MVSFITRAFIVALGYAYPAYDCFKCVERNRPDIEQLHFWCQYWIIIAALTVVERAGGIFTAWIPMYSEAKLAFMVYLWYPKTKGAIYVYCTFLRPFISKHELEIDRTLSELKTRAGDTATFYWRKGTTYTQLRFMELLRYMALDSASAGHQDGLNPTQIQPPPSSAQHQQQFAGGLPSSLASTPQPMRECQPYLGPPLPNASSLSQPSQPPLYNITREDHEPTKSSKVQSAPQRAASVPVSVNKKFRRLRPPRQQSS